MNTYVALLDTCVLAPMPLCHTLLSLAEEPALYLPRWSLHIMRELSRTLAKFGYSGEQITRRLRAMNLAFEDATVTGYEDLIAGMKNDQKDRHVLAAAVRAGAHAIVTSNVKHFQAEAVEQYNLVVTSPDDFLSHQFHREPGITVKAIEKQAADIHRSVDVLLMKLDGVAPQFTELIRQQVKL